MVTVEDIREQEAALYDEASERALIGSCAMDADAIYTVGVTPEQFGSPELAQIWRAMMQLSHDGVTINTLTIADALPDVGLARVNMVVGRCINSTPTLGGGASWYADRIVETAIRRKNRELGERLAREAYRPEIAPDVSAGKIVAELLSSGETSGQSTPRDKAARDAISQIVEWSKKPLVWDEARGICEVRGVPTGFIGLDKITDGFKSGLYLVCGPTHAGKTALALQCAESVAKAPGHGVLYMTFEQNARQMQHRQLCMMAGVSTRHAERGTLTQGELSRIVEGSRDGAVLNWHWYDGDQTLHAVLSQIHRAKARFGVDFVVIDNLKYVTAGIEKRYDNISAVVEALLTTQRRLDINIMMLHQVNREGSKADRPKIDDIRDSGEIAETAHVVWMLEKITEIDTGGSVVRKQMSLFKESGMVLRVHQDKNKIDGTIDSVDLFNVFKSGRLYDAKK